MKKSELRYWIKELLIESLDPIDFSNIKNLRKQEDDKLIYYKFETRNNEYELKFNKRTLEVIYGVIDPITKEVKTSTLTGDVFSVLPIVFAIMRHLVDELNLDSLLFVAETKMKQGLYKIMSEKVFPEFKIKFLPGANLFTIYK